mmetsp:Transcript_114850/g.366360  ORF Transcript_114850/g.366360 Transcript_114850/m.366360 type:complete len:898 (+) Transcript_114850:133-2826(+)
MTAAAARKLQKEIDNVLKKVDDGIGEFAEYWEQATAANSNQQKEKLGEELKRSINKLQRLRAQIREWIAQSGVQSNSKDKLEDARRRIENDMQRFKDFERELKTKAFSTCALARADELELEEAEKMKYQDWLTETIQRLNDQLDQFEADLELLGNKKSLSNDDKSRLAQLKVLQERHRWHIKKLELVLRAVDNDAIDMSDLAVVRESIELYVDNHQDPDCYHDEGLYECFDLAEFEDKAPRPRSPTEAPKECNSPTSSKEEPQRKAKEKEKRRKEDKKDKKKEEREKKAAGSPQHAASGGGGTTKASGGRNGDAKAAAPPSEDTFDVNHRIGTREKLDLDEVKVQEDQLLSEAEEFICKICQIHVVGCSPKLTSCSHLFCGDCIAQWFAQHPESQTWAQRARSAGPERVVPCPVCKQPLNEKRDLYPVCGVTSRSENLLLWRMLSSLKIMCANHPKVRSDGKCDWIGEYGSYQKHIYYCKNQSGEGGGAVSNVETLSQRTHCDSESEASLPACKDTEREAPAPGAISPRAATAPTATAAATGASTQGSVAAQARGQAAASANPAPPAAAPAAAAPATAPAAPAVAAAPTAPAPAGSAAASARAGATLQTAPAPATQAATAANTAAQAQSSRNAAAHEAASAEPSLAPKTGAPAHAAAAGHAPSAQESKAPAAATTNAQSQRGRFAQPEPQQEADGSFVTQAVSSFDPTGSNMVPVQAGDLIQVLEQHSSGWTFAKNLALSSSANAGWVPSWIVQPAQTAGAGRPQAATEAAAQTKQKAPETQQKEPARTQPAQAQAAQQAARVAATPAVQQVQAVQQPAQQAQTQPALATEARTVLRANAAFNATSASQLTLSSSDLVEIVERHASGWTYGRKVSEAASEAAVLEGWFPDWVVCPQK